MKFLNGVVHYFIFTNNMFLKLEYQANFFFHQYSFLEAFLHKNKKTQQIFFPLGWSTNFSYTKL